MVRKDIKVSDDLVCLKSPNFTWIATHFIQSKDCNVFFFLPNQIKLVSFFIVNKFFDFLRVREFFPFFIAQRLSIKPYLIMNDKSNR